MSEREDDFLSRWSRRKVEARDGGLQKKKPEPEHKPGRMRTDPPKPKEADPIENSDATAPAIQEAALSEGQSPAVVDEVHEETASEVDPSKWENFDFDSLNYGSDYTQFMKKGVPEVVRRRALSMLWQSNPILANIDGLNDYDEDFTDAAMVMKAFSSNYKVGSGYLTEEERMASYSEEARTVGSDAPDEETEESDVAEMDEPDVADVDEMDVEDMDDDDNLDDDDGLGDDTRFAQGESESGPEAEKSGSDNDTA